MKKTYIFLLLAVVIGASTYLIVVLNSPQTTTFGEKISPENIENIERMTILERPQSGNDGFARINNKSQINQMLSIASEIKLIETKPETITSDYLLTLYSENGDESYVIYTGSNYMDFRGNTGGSYTIDGANTLHKYIKNSDEIEWEYL